MACLDDGLLARLLPASLGARARALEATARTSTARTWTGYALLALVAWLSLGPVANLLSPGQVMNTSFDPLDLVNTHGAFGSVGRVRDEVVIEGTDDPVPGDAARWLEYELPCKPGDPARRPCVVAPFQPRLDWQLWFAAMSDVDHYPWVLELVKHLLDGDRGTLSLFAGDPFPDGPPRQIRIRLFEYRFARRGEPGWWVRTPLGEWLPPITRDDPLLGEPSEEPEWD